jgi:hypothetical protein
MEKINHMENYRDEGGQKERGKKNEDGMREY